jgi:hypothetical protein
VASNESKRWLTEAVVIVGSILLAFAIDAAWASRADTVRRRQLEAFLRSDIEVTAVAVDRREEWARQVVGQARGILEGLAAGAEGAVLDSLVFGLGDVFVKGYWQPTNQTYEQAVGGGDLALIEDPELRFLLGRYAGALEGVAGVQRSVITQYYEELEPFMVEHTDYAQVAWAEEADQLVQVGFTTDSRALSERRDFANLLNLKLELEMEMIAALDTAARMADELLARLGPGGP